jgi:hypothetical protein
MNWFSISSQRRTENKGISILLLIETSLTFVKSHSKSNNKYKQDEIIQTLDLLIDNIFVLFGGRVFQQTIGIPKDTNCAPLLVDLFLPAYEADFFQGLLEN